MNRIDERFAKVKADGRKALITFLTVGDPNIDTSVEETIHDYGNTILESSARNQYMILRVKRILRRTVL